MAVNSNINNDPFEEFEFRPINEGLGFHREKNKLTNNFSSSAASTISNFNTSTFSSPLPRNDMRFDTSTNDLTKKSTYRASMQIPTIEDDSIARAQNAVNDILKNLNQKRQIDFLHDTEKMNTELKKSKPYFFAAALDGMLITAAFLMSMIAMLTVTKIDLFMNLSHPETSGFVYAATLGLFLSITFIYMVVNRAFAGFTPGEWAFDQVCGNTKQTESLMYIPRLALRTLLVAATGFIVLPFLSYLFNKDVSGQMTGVSLFKKFHA